MLSVEGCWFAVPLDDDGYGLGLAARVGTRGGIILGYFFGPRHTSLPSQQSVSALKPTDAVLICHFTDTRLRSGEWPVVHHSSEWPREDWPQPAFSQIDVVDERKAFRREYPPDYPSELFILETQITLEEAASLPNDGL